jgi:hypothetical protein
MAEVLQPYRVQRFNAILDLADARGAFAANDGEAFINSVFIPLVKKRSLEEKVGLGLLHRHFDLEDGEKLVEFHNISTPWSVDIDEISLPVGGEILPTSWRIQDGKFMPYEFYFAPLNGRPTFKSFDLTDLSIRGFLKEFVHATKIANLEGYISLRLCPEGDFDKTLKITQPRANVNLSNSQVSK